VNTRSRHAAAASSSLPGPLLSDSSLSEELLATLAEPDDVLDSQVKLKLTDDVETAERHSPVFSSITEKSTNTRTGICLFIARFALSELQ